MVCSMCGTQLPEGTQICNCCGNQLVGYGYYVPAQQHKSKAKWIILISSIVAVIIAAISITMVIVLSDDEEVNRRATLNGTLEVFFEAIEENNYEKYLSLVPEYWQEYFRASLDNIMRNALEDYVDDFYCDNGNNQLYFEVTDMVVLDENELAGIRYDFENWYDLEGKIEQYVYLDITVKDIKGNEWTFSEFDFIKIDGIWYIGFGNI